MSAFVKTVTDDNSVEVIFNVEQDEVLQIGERIAEINEDAYMNGYNWEILLNCYLAENDLEIAENMDSDPEAGMYTACFENTPMGRELANRLTAVIQYLIEHEEELYSFVRENGEEIEWD